MRRPPPTKSELDELLATITTRVGRHLQRWGWLSRDAESSHLNLDRDDTALDSLLSHSITYRIALGPRAGQKAFTLQSLAATSRREPDKPFLATADGFSLHAGVAAGADDRKNVERLCRYIARPPVATGRLSLTSQGQVRVIACIEDPGVIATILAHLEQRQPSVTAVPLLPARGPPRQGLLELN